MRFTIDRMALVDALAVSGKGFSSRSTLPILSGILISAASGKVLLQSTDLEVSVRHSVEANVEEDGQMVLPGRLVSDIVRSLPDGAVTIDGGPEQATISCGHASFKVKTLPAEDFPKFPEVEADRTVVIPGELLASMSRQVLKAVSRDETRPILTGVLLVAEDTTLRMAATDSYRLSLREEKSEQPVEERIEVVVPGKAMDEVPKLAQSSEGVSIGVAENQIIFRFGQTVYISRRIEGSFPNYRQLIPKETEVKVRVSTQELLDAIRRVSLLAQHNAPLRMKVSESTLTLSAATPDVGEASEDLMAATEGAEMEIAFNHAFLADGVSSAPSEELLIELISPLKQGVLRVPEGGDEFVYIAMPVRLG